MHSSQLELEGHKELVGWLEEHRELEKCLERHRELGYWLGGAGS